MAGDAHAAESVAGRRRSPGERTGKRASKREQVLAAAARMFGERGYLGTSIDDIADALGSTKGRIYHYYRSKVDLYLDIHRAALLLMIDRISPLAELDLPPWEKLKRMAAAQLREVVSAGPMQKAGMQGIQRRTLTLSTAKQKRAMAAIVKLRDRYEDMFAQVIEAGIADGVFVDRPARLLAKPLQGAINWAYVWFDPDRSTPSDELETIIDVVAECAVNGLVPHGKPASQSRPGKPPRRSS